jgi:hypothetical protein
MISFAEPRVGAVMLSYVTAGSSVVVLLWCSFVFFWTGCCSKARRWRNGRNHCYEDWIWLA